MAKTKHSQMPNNGKPNTKNQAFFWDRMNHIDDCVGKSDSASKKRATCPVSISQTVPKPSVGNLDLFSFETMDDLLLDSNLSEGPSIRPEVYTAILPKTGDRLFSCQRGSSKVPG